MARDVGQILKAMLAEKDVAIATLTARVEALEEAARGVESGSAGPAARGGVVGPRGSAGLSAVGQHPASTTAPDLALPVRQ